MNLTQLSTAASLAQSAWAKFSDYRDEKAREAYSALEDAAKQASKQASSARHHVEGLDLDALPRTRAEAGAVTKAARARLERALAEFDERTRDARTSAYDAATTATAAAAEGTKLAGEKYALVRQNVEEKTAEARKQAEKKTKATRKDLKKQSRSAKKAAQKAAEQAAKKAAKATKKQDKKSSTFLPILGITALLAAGLGGAYYWLRGKDTPATKPPRVEDFGANKVAQAEGSTLVYSTTTEEPAERDEQLLSSIEEQLADHALNPDNVDDSASAADTDNNTKENDSK